MGPIVSRKDPIYEKIYELLNPNTFLTHQLWPKFYNPEFEKEHFDIPKLGIKGNLRESSRKIVEIIYNFNSPTKNIIHSIIEKLNLPPKYASIHIRRGDKATEVELLRNAVYIDRLKQETDLKSIFVSTDDFAVLAELEKNYGEFNFFTLTEKGEKGYVLEDFGKLSEEEKEHKMLILFASMEIICKSDCFVGTYITNLGNFAGMKMPDEKIHSVQKASWYQFEDEDVKDQYYFKERARELSSRS
ncbi:MAG: hypothetical protein K9G44_06995 [Melioribacteraceae bacterium]|nr:hypothetical protein [Melioribacteraceae bacterium]